MRKKSEVASTQNTGSITALLHNFYSLLACYDHLSDGWLEILLVYSRQDQWPWPFIVKFIDNERPRWPICLRVSYVLSDAMKYRTRL